MLAAGLAAGTINTVVGSGMLFVFPVLLGLGMSPVQANVSGTVGLVFGSVSGALGHRQLLSGQGGRLRRLGPLSAAGGLTGGLLLLVLPAQAFRAIVPALIALACVLVLAQPRLAAALGRGQGSAHGGLPLHVGIFGAGVYGGYFGAAQGVLLIALMGIFLPETLQRVNAAKNVLAGLVNGTAAVLFALVADVAWDAAALVALGSILGGQLGARIGRRLPDRLLRAVVVVVGAVAIWRILAG